MEFKYRPDEIEIKLMLLYIIKSLKTEATYTLLDYIVKDTAELNYFELKKYIDALIVTKDIKELRTNEGTLIYSITNTGEETVGFFAEKLPFTIREALNQKVSEINKKQNNSNEIKVDFYPVNTNEFAVKFHVIENGVPMLKLDFYAGSIERAKEMVKYINSNSVEVYSSIYECINSFNNK